GRKGGQEAGQGGAAGTYYLGHRFGGGASLAQGGGGLPALECRRRGVAARTPGGAAVVHGVGAVEQPGAGRGGCRPDPAGAGRPGVGQGAATAATPGLFHVSGSCRQAISGPAGCAGVGAGGGGGGRRPTPPRSVGGVAAECAGVSGGSAAGKGDAGV